MGILPATAIDAIGLIGVALYLVSYAALQLGFIRGQTYAYAALNALAATFVLLSLSASFNLASAVINACWVAISLAGIGRLAWVSYSTRFTDEERTFLNAKLPALPAGLARRFLNAGYWVDGDPGVTLTREGEPVPDLVYLSRGGAAVSLGDHVIGTCSNDTFVGEMTCLKGDPASATVTLIEPSRYFCIGAVRLRELCARNGELRRALDECFGSETSRKLLLANEQQRARAARRIEAGRADG